MKLEAWCRRLLNRLGKKHFRMLWAMIEVADMGSFETFDAYLRELNVRLGVRYHKIYGPREYWSINKFLYERKLVARGYTPQVPWIPGIFGRMVVTMVTHPKGSFPENWLRLVRPSETPNVPQHV